MQILLHNLPQFLANRLLALIFLPYLKKMYGKGIMAMDTKPSNDEAHWYPSFSYIWFPNRGNEAVSAR